MLDCKAVPVDFHPEPTRGGAYGMANRMNRQNEHLAAAFAVLPSERRVLAD
jgi:hypothetical protein